MTLSIYLTSETLAKQLGLDAEKTTEKHKIYNDKKYQVFWPLETGVNANSPTTFDGLIKKHNISSMCILDRATSKAPRLRAKEQINRSGINFLRGTTPYKKAPAFPDVSKALLKNESRPQITIGPKRFKLKRQNEKEDYFEWMAPIAILWHYFGIKTSGVGLGTNESSLHKIFKQTEK